MQFRIPTLLLIIGTFAVPLALTSAAGPFTQVMGMVTTTLAWVGVLLTHWASNWPRESSVLAHVGALTCGIFGTFVGILGVSLCIGHGLAAVFA